MLELRGYQNDTLEALRLGFAARTAFHSRQSTLPASLAFHRKLGLQVRVLGWVGW